MSMSMSMNDKTRHKTADYYKLLFTPLKTLMLPFSILTEKKWAGDVQQLQTVACAIHQFIEIMESVHRSDDSRAVSVLFIYTPSNKCFSDFQ